MKKIILLSAAILGIFSIASCVKETQDPTELGIGRTVISATVASTKTGLGALDDVNHRWPNYWKTGDVLSVNGVDSEGLDVGYNDQASAEFSFTSSLTSPYCAAYPASAVSGYSAGSATVTVPATQNYVDGSYDPEAFLLIGKSDTKSIALSSQVSVIHLSLTGTASITSVRLTGGVGAALSGSFTTDYATTLTPSSVSNVVEMVTASPVDLPAEFFICVPAGLSGALKVEVFDNAGGSMTKNASIASALAAGKVFSPSALAYTADSYAPVITAEGITSSTAVICWNNSPEAAYTIGVYSDSGCSSLVDSYSVDAGNACWGGNSPRFCISGLDAATTYYVKVTNDDHSADSNILPVTTATFDIVEVSNTPAAVDDVILAEDFGELRWDSDLIGRGVGYFATSQDSFANSEVSQFLPIDTNSEKVLGAQTTALGASRLAHWAQGENNNLYIHPGYIKLVGSKKVTHIVTPALESIPDGKLATIDVEVTASPYFSESSASFCTTNAIVAVQTGSLNELTDVTNTNTLDLTTNKQDITLDAASAWKTYKVTLSDVVKGNRIAFGAADGVSGNDARMLLSDIKITIKALDDPALTASVKSVSSSTAAFKWTYGGDASDDIAKPYTASLYSDSACTSLVVSHDFEANASCWDGKSPCFSFGGLAPSTTYWLVVEDTDSGTVADAVSATTEAFTPVDATTVSNAAVGDVILAEDFSEIGWGPDEFAVAAGIVPSPKNLDVLSGVNPAGSYTTYSNTGQRIFGTGVDLGTSRLSKGWGFFGNSATFLRDAYLRIASTTGRTHLVTPALAGIPAGKLATIDVTVTATKHESNTNDVAVFVSDKCEMNGATDPSSSSFRKYTIDGSATALPNNGTALGITSVKTWETKTVSISNIDSGCQLIIGSLENIDGKNRFSITDVKVTITALIDDPVMKIMDEATFNAFVSAVATDKTIPAKVTQSFTVSSATAEAFASIEDYEGTFDGNGYTITGLTKPLFNDLKGTVKDLTLNSTLNITSDQTDIGILANVLSGTATGCTSQGSVTFNVGSAVSGERRIGGMIGSISGTEASITACTNEASVTNETTNTTDGELIVGGVLSTSWVAEFSISDCSNTGTITNNAYWEKAISVGGIIGQAGNGASATSTVLNVSDCTNSGAVSNTGNSAASNNVGGVIGWIRHGTYSGNSNEGTVSNSGEAPNNYVGGVFGYVDLNCTFQNHSNSGLVSNSGEATSANNVGGIIGSIAGKKPNYNTIASGYKFTNSGSIENSGSAKNINIGGLLGRNNTGYFTMTGTSSAYCRNSGNITDTSGNAKSDGGDISIGGIVGYTTTGIKMQYARNSGDIYVTGDKGSSAINVGGIGGWISNASFNFNNCRNTGDVTVDATTTASIWAAGIVACPKPNSTNHYYWRSNATIDTHLATVGGENYTAGLMATVEGSDASSTFTMTGHRLAGTVWGSKTTTGLFCCTKNASASFSIKKGDENNPNMIAPGTVRKDNVNDNTINDISDVNIGVLAGGAGSTYDLTSVIADEHITVESW
jgi:hypothetical protein